MQKTKRLPNRALVEARLKRGWTQQQVADLIGTHPSTINRWEQGKTTPGPLFREKLKQLFGWNEQEFDPSSIIANALYELGNLFLAQGRIEEAENMFSMMRQISPRDDQTLFSLCQFGMARVQAARGKREEARELAELSFSSLQRRGNRQAKMVKAWLSENVSDK